MKRISDKTDGNKIKKTKSEALKIMALQVIEPDT